MFLRILIPFSSAKRKERPECGRQSDPPYDLLFGTNGIVLAPPFNPNTFAKAIADLMRRPDVRQQMAEEARRTAANFAPATIATQWEKRLEQLLHPKS